ncbi:MAG: helicase C-terminal domain-containing protein, partial [Candidatus Odinarchaeia archaeon]
ALNISSDSLSKGSVKFSISEAEKNNLPLVKKFGKKIIEIFDELQSLMGYQEEMIVPKDFIEDKLSKIRSFNPIDLFLDVLHEKGEEIQKKMIYEGKTPRSYIHRLSEFLSYWIETADRQDYCRVIRKYVLNDSQYHKLEIIALDPRKITDKVFKNIYASISISGTIQPLDAYVDMVGLPDNTVLQVLDSPFDEQNVLPLVVSGVSTALNQRVSRTYEKIISKICEVVDSTPANIGIFTASYNVLEGLLNNGLEDKLSKRLFIEKPSLSSRANDRMIRMFKKFKDRGGAVLIGVLGGRNSEGEDFPGDEMNSVIIVGIPYAKPTPSVKASIRYFDSNFPGRGREYAYLIPAMRRAAQAAGRVIRRLDDRGVIVFLDQRFKQIKCVEKLPAWISKNLKAIPDKTGLLTSIIKSFFAINSN